MTQHIKTAGVRGRSAVGDGGAASVGAHDDQTEGFATAPTGRLLECQDIGGSCEPSCCRSRRVAARPPWRPWRGWSTANARPLPVSAHSHAAVKCSSNELRFTSGSPSPVRRRPARRASPLLGGLPRSAQWPAADSRVPRPLCALARWRPESPWRRANSMDGRTREWSRRGPDKWAARLIRNVGSQDHGGSEREGTTFSGTFDYNEGDRNVDP